MPGIDIVIPSYNYGRYLADCVGSVQAQGIDDLRILIVDNASTDESRQVARRLAAMDRRIELRLYDVNRGAHASFNEGVDWAASDYFAILCADDLLAPNALRRAMRVMEANGNVHLAFGRTQFLSGARQPVEETSSVFLHPQIIAGLDLLGEFCATGRSPIGGPTAVVRTCVQKQAGHYRRELAHTDDVEMWMRFCALGDAARIDAVQVQARIHPVNQSAVVSNVHKWNLEMEKAFDAFFSTYNPHVPDPEHLHRIARHSLADRAYWCALSHTVRREPGVLDLLKFALSRRPSLAFFPPVVSLLKRDDVSKRVGATFSAMRARLKVREA